MDKSDFYNSSFYDLNSMGSIKSARKILPIVLDILPHVNSAVDFGCGIGTWLSVFKEIKRENCHIQGYDGKWIDQSKLLIPKEYFATIDFEEKIHIEKTYDLSISLEVAEHVPAKNAKLFVQKLVLSSDFVLFSAAVPFQRGDNHINEQWQSYWSTIFLEFDFLSLDCIRPTIWNDDDVEFWYRQNIFLYVKKNKLDKCNLNKELFLNSHFPKDIIHPDNYLWYYMSSKDKNIEDKVPFFSLIVAVYNVEQYLKRCLDSIIHQTYSGIEIILINDGSTDNSGKICDEYAEKDNRIIVIHQQNSGLGEARNVGMRKAIGEFLIFVDSDDWINTFSCEKFYQIIRKRPDIEIICSSFIEFVKKGVKEVRYFNFDDESEIFVTGIDFWKMQLKNENIAFAVWHKVYSRNFLLNNQLDNQINTYAEDFLWTPRIMLLAKKVVVTNFIFYTYFYREGSLDRPMTTLNKLSNAKIAIEICHKNENLFINVPDEELNSLWSRYLFNYYFNRIKEDKLYKRKYKHFYDVNFLMRNAQTKIEKMQVILFRVIPTLYFRFFKQGNLQ